MKNNINLARIFLIIPTLIVSFLVVPAYAIDDTKVSLIVTYTNRTGDNLTLDHIHCKHGRTIDHPGNIQNNESTSASFKRKPLGLYNPNCTVTFINDNSDKISIRTYQKERQGYVPIVTVTDRVNLMANITSTTYYREPNASICLMTGFGCEPLAGTVKLDIIKK